MKDVQTSFLDEEDLNKLYGHDFTNSRLLHHPWLSTGEHTRAKFNPDGNTGRIFDELTLVSGTGVALF